MDPVVVLKETDTFKRQVRDAAFQVYLEDRKRSWSLIDE